MSQHTFECEERGRDGDWSPVDQLASETHQDREGFSGDVSVTSATLVGKLEGAAVAPSAKKAAAAAPKPAAAGAAPSSTALVSVPVGMAEPFGDQIPYGDPAW